MHLNNRGLCLSEREGNFSDLSFNTCFFHFFLTVIKEDTSSFHFQLIIMFLTFKCCA